MKKNLLVALLFVGFFQNSFSQEAQPTEPITTDSLSKSLGVIKKDVENLKHLKISGWVQAQFQVADTAGARNFDGGDFPILSSNRFLIRRGRIKFTYTLKNVQFVLQFNATERGVNLTDFYGKYSDPWRSTFSLTAGVMNRPFGFEIQQSSVDRESPERSRFTQSLMPNERDLGAMLSFQPQKERKLYGLKVDAGFYNGTGIAVPGTGTPPGSASGVTLVNGFTDFDSKKDFIGHAVYYDTAYTRKVRYGFGVSHYNGGYAIQNNRYYNSIGTDAAGNKVWVIADTINHSYKYKTAPRIYYGVEGLVSISTFAGTTTLRGEYFTGIQTGRDTDSRSPQAAPPTNAALYKRNFNAGYIYFIQRFGKSKHEGVVKYEWYDPNSKVTATDLNGANAMKEGEIKYTMVGIGYNLYLTPNVKFMFHYNIVTNEITKIAGYTRNLKDNIFTARMQVRF